MTAETAASAPASPGADGEHKQVTVLFADVKGSMDLAESTEPEQWRRIMQRFYGLLSEGVQKFEGTVDKFTGDGIMALFGAPIAHEDHAARACYAALQIRDMVSEYAGELRRTEGMNFSVRIGINSGEVIAGAIGEGDQPSYTAVGHTVGLAQRMEALAEPGKAYLTEHSARLAEGYLELRDLGEFEVKGASRPIGVYELVGIGRARSRLDLARERGLSRFVGRAREIEILEEALARAKAGEGSVVGIVADPGVGKSRLCHEFAERCRAQGIEVYEAQAQAHGRSIPMMPVLQILRDYFGIEDQDSERTAREKIAGRLLLLDQGFADDLPLVFDFLSVPDPARPAPQISGEARQRALRGVVRRLYRVPNREDTVVNVIEDLHWMDEGSEDLLREMVSAIEGTRTLAVVNFRPGYEAEWTGFPIFRPLALVPLGPDDTADLLESLAGDDPSLDGFGELIHERTGGNPFFIEEIVRELAESGYLEGKQGEYRLARPVEDTGVPATVQAILAARIDRLRSESKRALQAASVIGKEASEPALRRVCEIPDEALDEALRELTAAGFLYEAELYPERMLEFCHPLTREVAYGSQLGEQRAAAHAATARAMIELSPKRHDEQAALIAQHLEDGGEALEAARWYARAAHWAGYSHPRDAMRLWEKVAELVQSLPDSDETSALAVSSRLRQLDYAWRLGMESARAESLAEEAHAIATRSGDLRSLALLQLLSSARPGIARDGRSWMRGSAAAIELADRSGDDHMRTSIRCAGSYAYLCAGEWTDCERFLDEALEIADGDPGVGAGILIGCPLAWALMAKAIMRRDRGELEAADEMLEEATRIATERGDTETVSWTRGNRAVLLAYRGEADQGVALAQRNYEQTERLGDVFSRTWALTSLAFALVRAGDAAAALDAVERGDTVYREAMASGGEAEAWRQAIRAEALLGLDRADEAAEQAEAAADVARSRGMRWGLTHAALSLARARVAVGDPAAREALDEAVRVAREVGSALVIDESEELAHSLHAASG